MALLPTLAVALPLSRVNTSAPAPLMTPPPPPTALWALNCVRARSLVASTRRLPASRLEPSSRRAVAEPSSVARVTAPEAPMAAAFTAVVWLS